MYFILTMALLCIAQVACVMNGAETDMVYTNRELMQRFQEMERRMSTLEQENQALKERVAVLEDENESLTNDNDEVTNARGYGNSTHARRLVLSEESPVAFLATLATPHKEEHLGVNQNIIFDTVLTNIGGAFNVNHGIFIVPRAGIYLISATILSWVDIEFRASIMVNAQRTVNMFGHGTSGRHEQGTQVAVLQLNAGDTVTVENIDLSDIAIWGDSVRLADISSIEHLKQYFTSGTDARKILRSLFTR